jgi:phage tail sheath protein FI
VQSTSQYATPGVYRKTEYAQSRWREFHTGVPVFLGLTTKWPANPPQKWPTKPPVLSAWEQFKDYFGDPKPGSYLPYAVRGFFENGGQQCYVVPLRSLDLRHVEDALHASEPLHTVDLVCLPDLFATPDRPATAEAYRAYFQSYAQVQAAVVQHCAEVGGRFAILDTDRTIDWELAWKLAWELWSEIDGPDGAIYHPWIKVRGMGTAAPINVPPCGHVAGIYSRSDLERGVHKAPANELLRGVIGLEYQVTEALQAFLNPKGVNCLRVFPGRGIRVWGARTLAAHRPWRYINVRRVFTTAIRWLQWSMWDVVFEPNDPGLWARIERELSSYLTDQYHRGALKGRSPQEAFYVKCNAETNPPEFRDAGQVVTEIGLAVTPEPFEFVIVRLIQGIGGVRIAGPMGSWQPIEGE